MVRRWGIIGTGWVSENFSTELIKFAPINDTGVHHVVTAVGSSSVEKADKFISGTLEPLIESLAIENPSIVASLYDDVYTNPDVDIVYVGSPHVKHLDNVLAAIHAGKNVLCEKPVTVNAKQLKQILDAARKKNVFFMEALWVKFLPATTTLVDRIYGEEKVIGDVKKVNARYSFSVKDKGVGPEQRLVNKRLGGGACLDIGVYPFTYLRLLLDPRLDPLVDWKMTSSEVKLDSLTGNEEDKVDFSTSATFVLPKYDQTASLHTDFYEKSLEYDLCVIEGTKGIARLRDAGLPNTWEYTIEVDGKKTVTKFENKVPNSHGYYFQVAAVGIAIEKGEKQTSIASWGESLAEMTILDKVRHDNGFYYEEDLN